jgi:hypothetical protein
MLLGFLTRTAGVRGAFRLLVLLVRIDDVAFRVLIVMANPGHAEVEAIFVAALGDEIEEVVNAHEDVESARVCGIGMKNFARGVLGEDTGAGTFLARKLALAVIVGDLASGFFFRLEGDVIVEIEIASEGRDPLELPAHALLERIDLGERCARNRGEHGIAIGKVNGGTIEVIRDQGTAWATFLPAGAEHEMVHDELAASVEKIGQCQLAMDRVKFVSLLHFFPKEEPDAGGSTHRAGA